MKTAYPITTQAAVRSAFWEQYASSQMRAARRAKKRQNDYPTDIRVSFVDFVDSLQRDGQISDKLADRVTL